MTTNMKGIGHGPAQVGGPPADKLPGWRAACAAYRRECQKDIGGGAIWRATVAAYMDAMPGATREEADEQAGRAVYWASVYHNEWLFPR